VRRGFAIYLIATFVSMALVAYSQEVTPPLPAPSTTTVVDSPDSKATLSSLRLKPNVVRAGENAKATVTLSAAAPEGGLLAKLSSSNPQVGDVDPSVTIDTGSRSATVIISTSPTSASSISISPVSYRFTPAFVQPASSAQYPEETTSPDSGDCPDENANGICDDEETSPPKSTPPENTPPENTPPENTPPENTPPENTPSAPENTPPENTPPENTPPENTPPGDDCADVNENGICDVKEHTQRPEAKSVKQTVEVKITASLKGVTRSATLTVKGV
jgi:hypothetical protein